MEIQPGVFLTNADAEESWRPDLQVGGGWEENVLFDMTGDGGAWAGLSRVAESAGPETWTPPSRQVLFVLEGEVGIEIAGGPSLDLKPGDMASLEAGIETTWTFAKLPYREVVMLV